MTNGVTRECHRWTGNRSLRSHPPGGMDPDGDPRLTATGRVAARPVGVLIQGLTGQVGHIGRPAPIPNPCFNGCDAFELVKKRSDNFCRCAISLTESRPAATACRSRRGEAPEGSSLLDRVSRHEVPKAPGKTTSGMISDPARVSHLPVRQSVRHPGGVEVVYDVWSTGRRRLRPSICDYEAGTRKGVPAPV